MTKTSTILVGLLLLAASSPSARAEEGASTALGSTVEQAWIADEAIPSYLLAAKMRDGKLQLFGAVESAKQREEAVAMARKLAGDTPVEDHIEITKIASLAGPPAVSAAGPTAVPSQDVAAALVTTVEEAWIADGKIPDASLAAKLRDGSLQLFGAVETPEQRASAVAIAKKEAGEIPVVSHIAVKK